MIFSITEINIQNAVQRYLFNLVTVAKQYSTFILGVITTRDSRLAICNNNRPKLKS